MKEVRLYNLIKGVVNGNLTDEERQYLINKFNSLENGLKALIESSVGANHK